MNNPIIDRLRRLLAEGYTFIALAPHDKSTNQAIEVTADVESLLDEKEEEPLSQS